MTDYTDHLATGSTTLCRCFRLTRPDGVVLGFTDLDEDVAFDGLAYIASAALTATEAASKLGLAPDEMEGSGALSDDAITEADILAGKYDGASIEVWDVDWTNPATRNLIGRYYIGEIERGGLGFRAEMRSITALIDRAEGRVHTTLCDARLLGDARCRLDLAAWRGTATVLRVEGLEMVVGGLEGFPSGFFSRGTVRWLTGHNTGPAGERDIRVSARFDDETTLSLWQPTPVPILVGDTLEAVAGCDRTAATCHSRFDNIVNFRGFPHMPGQKFLREQGTEGDPDQTGGSRFE